MRPPHTHIWYEVKECSTDKGRHTHGDQEGDEILVDKASTSVALETGHDEQSQEGEEADHTHHHEAITIGCGERTQKSQVHA